MEHHFDIDIAKEYGLIEAILLNNFWFWIEKNKANNVNYINGSYWTYNSTKAFTYLFPYLSQRQIQNALKHLRDKEILKTGKHNKSSYDQTLWYAFTDKGKSIMQKCKIEDTNKGNRLCENVKPIPDNKPYKKPDNKLYIDEFAEIWKKYPKKQSKEKALEAYIIARENGVEYDTILNGVKRYSEYCKTIDNKYIKLGSNWFSGSCWKDDYAKSQPVRYNGFGEVVKEASYDINELMRIK